MNEFKRYHPIVNFAYFAFAAVFSCVFLHPAALAISLICSFAYSVVIYGIRGVKKSLAYILPLFVLAAVINPAFNHGGATILAYLPSGNPLTLESICYGLAAAVMLANMILLFSCMNGVMTSDKIIYLFGRVMPSMSLIISMTLRFVPRFARQFKAVTAAQKCIGRDAAAPGIIRKARNGLSILSVMVTLSLENSVDTADSMHARGYGLPGRSAFAIYTFTRRDTAALCTIAAAAAYVIIGAAMGALKFSCFPYIQGAELSAYGVTVFFAYFILLSMPIAAEITEVIKWKYIKSKI